MNDFKNRFKTFLIILAFVQFGLISTFVTGTMAFQPEEGIANPNHTISTVNHYPTLHKTVHIDGLDIFYREAI